MKYFHTTPDNLQRPSLPKVGLGLVMMMVMVMMMIRMIIGMRERPGAPIIGPAGRLAGQHQPGSCHHHHHHHHHYHHYHHHPKHHHLLLTIPHHHHLFRCHDVIITRF